MIYIAGDKYGFEATEFVQAFLKDRGIAYENLGVRIKGADMDLEQFIPAVCKKVLENPDNLGILTCGTGIGVMVGANKIKGIRSCLATNEQIAEWARVYDDCNVLSLVGWNPSEDQIKKILDAWFKAEYDGNENRRKMLNTFDTWK